MKFNSSMAIVALVVLVNIQTAIGRHDISLEHMFPASWIDSIVAWHAFLAYVGTSIIGAIAAPSAFRGKVAGAAAALAAAVILFGPGTAGAADLPINAPKLANPFSSPYDLTRCGGYFGVNTLGSASGVSGTGVQPGTQVDQGGIGGQVGYGCPISAANGSYWFVEAMADVTNLNGATNGLALGGPAQFTERFGAGTPLNSILGLIVPNSTAIAVPNLPTLPNGITAGPANPYAFVALHEKDISLSNGLSQNREWLISWGIGLGVRYRLSNQLVADVFAEYQANTQTICVGAIGNAGCVKPGQGAMVGLAFDY